MALIFITDNKYSADLKAYKETNKNNADMHYFVTDNKYKAKGDSIWYFTDNKYKADKKVYWESNKYNSDLKVYKTDNKKFTVNWPS